MPHPLAREVHFGMRPESSLRFYPCLPLEALRACSHVAATEAAETECHSPPPPPTTNSKRDSSKGVDQAGFASHSGSLGLLRSRQAECRCCEKTAAGISSTADQAWNQVGCSSRLVIYWPNY